ncbi:hypothetical protein JOD45_000766 [Scopulibacillus daqui]|uniref:Bacterial CdiA-CT RNAse A domain-containing protein n=1 Tax=Scopulibacillus daqui TaxID=1469162 RepID=A0ABS2PX86_9BACL|nr:RNase A-like domain-containing lipoprotein [Scopulibacillus daqui]MBM7644573.1 hypothetical protein [Scopulibacillus daqui]
MKWVYLFLAALFTSIMLLSGCSQTAEKHHGDSKTHHISNNILDEMEGPPKNGHTLARHVGKSDHELEARIRKDHISAASTYYDKETATKAVQEALRIHDKKINNWLNHSNRNRLVLKTHHSFAVGKAVLRSDMEVHPQLHDTITVLQKDPSGKLGYKIITSYPTVKAGR